MYIEFRSSAGGFLFQNNVTVAVRSLDTLIMSMNVMDLQSFLLNWSFCYGRRKKVEFVLYIFKSAYGQNYTVHTVQHTILFGQARLLSTVHIVFHSIEAPKAESPPAPDSMCV